MAETERLTGLASINLDDIAEIGEIVPVGRYCAALAVCNGKTSKNGNPMLEVRYEVKQGDQMGSEIAAWYTLTVTRGKNGKLYSPGLQELKAIFTAVGVPAPSPFPLDQTLAAQAFGIALAGKLLDIHVIAESRDEDELDAAGNKTGNKKKVTRNKPKIVGLWSSNAAATPGQPAQQQNPLAGIA